MISVIRALSASETNEQREIEKAKLEKEYKRSDQRLDELVSLHDQDLTEVMQVNLHICIFIKKHKYVQELTKIISEATNLCNLYNNMS